MTLVGKIFTVAIFAMSIVYMGFAMAVYSAHRNWKEYVSNPTAADGKPLGLEHQLKERDDVIAKQQQDILKLNQKLDDVVKAEEAQRAKLETALQTELATNAQLKTQVASLEQDNRDKVAALATAEEESGRKTAEVAKLRDDVRTALAKRDEMFDKIVDVTEKLHAAHGRALILEERKEQLVDQIARYGANLRQLGVKNPDAPLLQEPIAVAGIITAVKGNNLIEISIGEDDGIKVGNMVHMYRPGRAYLGRAQVIEISPDRAVAKILVDQTTGNVEKGDSVATKLKVS